MNDEVTSGCPCCVEMLSTDGMFSMKSIRRSLRISKKDKEKEQKKEKEPDEEVPELPEEEAEEMKKEEVVEIREEISEFYTLPELLPPLSGTVLNVFFLSGTVLKVSFLSGTVRAVQLITF